MTKERSLKTLWKMIMLWVCCLISFHPSILAVESILMEWQVIVLDHQVWMDWVHKGLSRTRCQVETLAVNFTIDNNLSNHRSTATHKFWTQTQSFNIHLVAMMQVHHKLSTRLNISIFLLIFRSKHLMDNSNNIKISSANRIICCKTICSLIPLWITQLLFEKDLLVIIKLRKICGEEVIQI